MELTGKELSCLISDALACAYTDLGNTFEFISPDRLGEIVADRIGRRILEYQNRSPLLHKIFTLQTGKMVERDFEKQDQIALHFAKVSIKVIENENHVESAKYQRKVRVTKI